MKDIEKLKHLIHHWKEHNDEHAESYKQWAERMMSLDNKELYNILMELYEETKKLNIIFEKVSKEMKKYESHS